MRNGVHVYIDLITLFTLLTLLASLCQPFESRHARFSFNHQDGETHGSRRWTRPRERRRDIATPAISSALHVAGVLDRQHVIILEGRRRQREVLRMCRIRRRERQGDSKSKGASPSEHHLLAALESATVENQCIHWSVAKALRSMWVR